MRTKNLIFSHKSDIDGMGCVVLFKLAFEDEDNTVDYVLCEGHNIDKVFKGYFLSQKLLLYDRIYVTDLHLNEENLSLIDSNNILKSRVKVIDHNNYALKYNKYDFVTVREKHSNGMDACATTLLFEHLRKQKLINVTISSAEFCEATRRQDTGIWKTELSQGCIENPARDLSILFGAIGQEKYIDIMCGKLRSKRKTITFFNEEEMNIVNEKTRAIASRIKKYLETIKVKMISGKKAGIFHIRYEDRNELAQYIREHKDDFDLEFIVLIPEDKNTISLRNIDPTCNVGVIAENLHGKGHFGAAGINITNEYKDELLRIFG